MKKTLIEENDRIIMYLIQNYQILGPSWFGYSLNDGLYMITWSMN